MGYMTEESSSCTLHCACCVLTPSCATVCQDLRLFALAAVEVLISGVEPQPIPLYPGSEVPLFNPVVHMRSDLNRTKDWSWPGNGARTKFDHWRVLSTVKPYSFVPEVMEGDGDGELYEGWWNVKVCD